MKRLLYLLPLLLLSALPARAQLANAQGWCEAGAQQVNTSGLLSSNTVQGSFPSCTISVSIHAGGIATIFSTGSGTPLSNPFTATTTGRWLFYAANGEYDITMTGGGLTSPVTYSDVFIGTGGGGGGGVTSVSATSPIVATPNPITSAGTISCPTCNTSGATIAGSISTGQVAVGSATNTISGSANLTYTSQDLVLLNSAANTLTLQNSTAANSGANQSSPITLAIGNYWTGAASAQDIYTFQDIVSAGNNPVTSLNFAHSGSSSGGNYGFAGNVNVSNSLTAANATVTGVGSLIIKGASSGQAAIGVPATAGTPNSLNLPTTTGTSGQFLQTDGGNPQQTSWQTVPIPITGCATVGGVAFENGTNNTLTCESQNTWDSTNHSGYIGVPQSSFQPSFQNYFNPPPVGPFQVNLILDTTKYIGFAVQTQAPPDGSALSGNGIYSAFQGYGNYGLYDGIVSDLLLDSQGQHITQAPGNTGIASHPVINSALAGTVDAANSYYSDMDVTGADTVTIARGFYGHLAVEQGAGSITNSYGAFITNAVPGSGTKAANQFGYYVDHVSGGATSNWGFFSDSANSDHFGSVFSGTDNSVAGSYTASNSAANAHTTWASGATTTNTIKGFTVVPANGDLVTCTVASTTCTLTDGGAPFNPAAPGAIGGTTPAAGSFTTLKGTTINTTTNCSSSASPAVCGSAAAGSVALPTNAVSSSIQVNTTAVTANSQIFAFTDDTLGTKLGVTCNSTIATLVGGLTISARSAGASFTIANNVAVVTNPLCVSYLIIN